MRFARLSALKGQTAATVGQVTRKAEVESILLVGLIPKL